MNNTLHDPQVSQTLNRLHNEAGKDMPRIIKGFAKSIGRSLRPKDMVNAYIAITREQGLLLYNLLRMTQAQYIVEFGTSFGISTLYLGAAARDNGGRVITTEIEPTKCKVARENIAAAGLSDVITLLEGDAMVTLQDAAYGIDHLFLDGWNDLYLPLLNMLEPKLSYGASILTDNASFASAKPLLGYIQQSADYLTTPLKTDKGTTELSCYLPASVKEPVH
ncbi:MAG: class I SAM-dependent methyltransferase [Bacteroidota bacterium]